jgi:hypothetical protein
MQWGASHSPFKSSSGPHGSENSPCALSESLASVRQCKKLASVKLLVKEDTLRVQELELVVEAWRGVGD